MKTNRISPHQQGWLEFLVHHQIATQEEARAAMLRVSIAAAEALERRRRRSKRRRRDK